ncbi:helix-turn-helix domain-containing protein [Streptococcus gallolyticus subsp. gallolyticus]|uniref:Transcriptional regulator, Cro/CI family n=1 Tax=Streptococcus gallolyticus (strain UCN34) TaxID=637909 RepID=A0AA36NR18_STRG3|nr:helix-turn-helix transcriptional regulator [Streptococcus gallolyticus]MCL4889165.1 helix-turn-helix domain-containing protein [Streptococcus gallolyticus]CBI14199.1 putative transcriptional regulator, Cro/CI family [Streptococcus gallolyticus UCN34]
MFPKRLKKLRKEANLTQQELAKNLNVSQQIIGLWERGERKPKIEAINNIAKYFNVSTEYLQGKTDNKEIEEDELELANTLFRTTVKELNLTPEQKEQFKKDINAFIERRRKAFEDDL